MSTELTGIVLCGGESRRMGADKGLLPWAPPGAAAPAPGAPPAAPARPTAADTPPTAAAPPLTWAGRAVALIERQGLPWLISVRSAQVDTYEKLFGDRLVLDDGEAPGPLGGLLSAYHACPGTDLLLLACDMTAIDEAILDELLKAYKNIPDEDFFVYQTDGFAEPFPGIYRARAIKPVESLQLLLRGGRTHFLPVTRPEAFINRNTP
ncbi:molybdenum cofactor guanylyltransferase [Dinghuibacter silviterrae]|uniref:Molybdopterin-guanine dinucleotide biosynthesis protein A n=1 Tax=Dinghuibacter silviterrae TaxID=1539049 RepID=A0A4R8DRZ9_9BACT|nr:molybdenum cofactor guanylyltransferase [Dinghuibacter silviterrae]TDX01012.1 molybdopterin-guanine dinucleotide biosynthesis protein A [Dinghuibacter silviterrae]